MIPETPLTCWNQYSERNAVYGMVPGPRQESRPNTFYFGDLGDDVEACAAACARESNCKVILTQPLHHNASYFINASMSKEIQH